MNDSALEREIRSGKPVVTMTWGDSMEPLLFHQSTRVVIRKVEGDLKKGDLPVYRRPSGQFVMHRIVGVRKDCYETRGDNRFGVEQVPREWVLGVVTEIYRKEKHILVTDWRYRLYVKLWCGGYPAPMESGNFAIFSINIPLFSLFLSLVCIRRADHRSATGHLVYFHCLLHPRPAH